MKNIYIYGLLLIILFTTTSCGSKDSSHHLKKNIEISGLIVMKKPSGANNIKKKYPRDNVRYLNVTKQNMASDIPYQATKSIEKQIVPKNDSTNHEKLEKSKALTHFFQKDNFFKFKKSKDDALNQEDVEDKNLLDHPQIVASPEKINVAKLPKNRVKVKKVKKTAAINKDKHETLLATDEPQSLEGKSSAIKKEDTKIIKKNLLARKNISNKLSLKNVAEETLKKNEVVVHENVNEILPPSPFSEKDSRDQADLDIKKKTKYPDLRKVPNVPEQFQDHEKLKKLVQEDMEDLSKELAKSQEFFNDPHDKDPIDNGRNISDNVLAQEDEKHKIKPVKPSKVESEKKTKIEKLSNSSPLSNKLEDITNINAKKMDHLITKPKLKSHKTKVKKKNHIAKTEKQNVSNVFDLIK